MNDEAPEYDLQRMLSQGDWPGAASHIARQATVTFPSDWIMGDDLNRLMAAIDMPCNWRFDGSYISIEKNANDVDSPEFLAHNQDMETSFSEDFSEGQETVEIPRFYLFLEVTTTVPSSKWDGMTNGEIKEHCNDL